MRSIVAFLLQHMMATLMLSVGIGTTRAALIEAWHQRRLVGRALVLLLAAIPLLAIVITTLFPLGRDPTAFMLLMSVCPGAPLVLRSFGDRPAAVVTFAIVSLLAPLTVTAELWLMGHALGFPLPAAPSAVIPIALRQVGWLALGFAIGSLFPRAATVLGRIAWWLFAAGFVVAVVVVVVKSVPALVDEASPNTLLAVVAMVFASIALGHVAGGPHAEDRRMLATMAVLGNPALALAVIAASYPGYRPGALVGAYVLLRALALLPYTLWSKRRA